MSDLPNPDDAPALFPTADSSHGAVQSAPLEFPDKCTRCGTTDPAVDGRCPNPKCRCLRKGTQLAAKGGPVNKTRRDQLRARFLQDYRPSTTIDEIRCRELADIAERLSVLKKGSSEYQRLVQTMASLDEALRSARSAPQQPPNVADLSNEELIARLETLLAAARAAQRKPEPAERVVAEPEAVSENDEDHPRASNVAAPDPSPAPKSDASPTILCPYCNSDPCVGDSHPSFYALHPEAAQARDEAIREREFRQQFGLPVERDEPTRPGPTHEECKQAEVRKALGWDKGVLNTDTGHYRYRE